MARIDFENPSAEEIARHYTSAMDSVDLINGAKPAGYTDKEWSDCVSRNKQHLNIMLSKTWWTTEDLGPLRAAAS